LRPAVVLGVQARDVATAVAYAKHAEKVGADAIISLPPSGSGGERSALEYYQAVGGAVNLPLFVQSAGDMSIDAILECSRAVPTLRYVKDEAGQPLDRIRPLRERSGDELKVFSGAHGRTLIEEMRRGSSGSMPAASFADLYAQTWDLWQQGQHRAAMDMHARTLLLLTEMNNYGSMEPMKYILCERGVFKTYAARERPRAGAEGTLPTALAPLRLDEAARQSLRETLEYVKPYLRA
jgi:4-hydroxy-tetrahydrodipicolinate synthase